MQMWFFCCQSITHLAGPDLDATWTLGERLGKNAGALPQPAAADFCLGSEHQSF